MAAGYLSKPGTEYGPCEGGCEHRDCAATREMAATVCRFCGEPIGYDRGFYWGDRIEDRAHASCAEAAADREAGR